MPIIFFVISLFLSNQANVSFSSKSVDGSTVKETTKPTTNPADGREFIVGADVFP